MREKIAERIYIDWNQERGLEWEDLPDYRKIAYRDWVDDYILKPQCEEIEKVECGHYASGYSEEAQDIGKGNMKQKILALLK